MALGFRLFSHMFTPTYKFLGKLIPILVACKRRRSIINGAWLRRFDDVTGVVKTDILR